VGVVYPPIQFFGVETTKFVLSNNINDLGVKSFYVSTARLKKLNDIKGLVSTAKTAYPRGNAVLTARTGKRPL